jgi:hypothetical protein
VDATTITAVTAAATAGSKDVFVACGNQMGALPRGYWYGGRRYYRVTLLNGTSGTTTIQVAELNLYDDFAGRWIEPALSGPASVTATATAFTSSAAWKLFDGIYATSDYNNGYMSSTANSFVAIDLGGLYKVSRYRLWTSTYSDGGGTYRPSKWQLDASNDASNWTTIDSRDISPSAVPAGSFIEFPATPL